MKKMLLPLGLFVVGVFLSPMIKPMLTGLFSKIIPTTQEDEPTKKELED